MISKHTRLKLPIHSVKNPETQLWKNTNHISASSLINNEINGFLDGFAVSYTPISPFPPSLPLAAGFPVIRRTQRQPSARASLRHPCCFPRFPPFRPISLPIGRPFTLMVKSACLTGVRSVLNLIPSSRAFVVDALKEGIYNFLKILWTALLNILYYY